MGETSGGSNQSELEIIGVMTTVHVVARWSVGSGGGSIHINRLFESLPRQHEGVVAADNGRVMWPAG